MERIEQRIAQDASFRASSLSGSRPPSRSRSTSRSAPIARSASQNQERPSIPALPKRGPAVPVQSAQGISAAPNWQPQPNHSFSYDTANYPPQQTQHTGQPRGSTWSTARSETAPSRNFSQRLPSAGKSSVNTAGVPGSFATSLGALQENATRGSESLAAGLRLPQSKADKLGVVLPTGVFVAGLSEEDLPLSPPTSSHPFVADGSGRSRQADSTTLAVLDGTRAAKHPSWQLSAMPNPPLPRYPSIHILLHYARQRRQDEDLGQNLSHVGVKRPVLMYPGVRYGIIEQQKKMRSTWWLTTVALFSLAQLNPHGVPWAFAQLGILFGILVVAVLGLTTFCCYYFLWQAFLDADSVQYPAKTLQSLAERVLGLPLGALIGLAQLTQLLIIASTLVLSTGRLLSQLINGVDSESVGGQMKLCFMIILAISAGLAVTSSFARRLRFHLGSSHVFVVILLAGCICVMLSAHRDGPITYTADIQVAFSGIYNSATSLKEKLNALMQLVFAFGAGICLVEIMSEMRRPAEFDRCLALGQGLAVILYMVFGSVTYAMLGQFTTLPSYLSLANASYARLVKGLVISSNVGATALFGNVGGKLLYANLIDRFDGPLLLSTQGRFIWYAGALIFWGAAFVFSALVPQASMICRFIMTLLALPFAVAIPASISLALAMQRDAAKLDAFESSTLEIKASDEWCDASRWRRSIRHRWYVKALLALLVVASLAFTGLCLWALWPDVLTAFQQNTTVASGCSAPAADFYESPR